MATNDELTKRVLWKLDLHVLPPLSLLCLANFIDRSNIGNVRIAGLEADTHLKDTQFNVVLAVFFATYILVELPSNWVMKKFKANRWLPFLVASWGVVTVLTSLAQNYGGLIAIRLAIGFCEGGILPGMVLYLSTLYKRHELQLRVGIFYSFAAIAGAFGGLLATAIMKMDSIGGLAGWRWIFILEGIVTILFAVGSAFILPADLQSAKFFTDEERAHALRRVKADGAPSPGFTRSDPSQNSSSTDDAEKAEVEVAVRPVMEHVIDDEEEECFEWREVIRVPPYVPAAVLTVVVAYISDRFKCRGPCILICLPMPIIGYALAIRATNDYERYAAVFLMAAGIYPSGPCILSILPNNTSGHYKKATTTAMQLAIANAAGFLATFVYTEDQKPKYIKGHIIALTFVALAWVLIAANVCYCLWENKARREGRRQGNIQQYLDLVAAGKTRAPIGDRHPDFRFTL
ncbi:MFS general substrate transporter [Schizophyllum commune Loenen D]|nr:MFS general substrate transporter [Schizophyllum commune Loenen D]